MHHFMEAEYTASPTASTSPATSTYLLGTRFGGRYSAKNRSSQLSSRFGRACPLLGADRVRTDRSGLRMQIKRALNLHYNPAAAFDVILNGSRKVMLPEDPCMQGHRSVLQLIFIPDRVEGIESGRKASQHAVQGNQNRLSSMQWRASKQEG